MMRKNFVVSEEYDLNCELKILAEKTGLTFYTNYINQENSIYDNIEVGVELLDVIGAPVIPVCSGSLWEVDEYLQTIPNNITEFLFSVLCDYTDILEDAEEYVFVIRPQNNGNFSIDIKDWETEDNVDGGYNLTFSESLFLLQEYASY